MALYQAKNAVTAQWIYVYSYKINSKILAVCGGGALNTQLMCRLQALCPSLQVVATDALGLPALQVEAAAFAWLETAIASCASRLMP